MFSEEDFKQELAQFGAAPYASVTDLVNALHAREAAVPRGLPPRPAIAAHIAPGGRGEAFVWAQWRRRYGADIRGKRYRDVFYIRRMAVRNQREGHGRRLIEEAIGAVRAIDRAATIVAEAVMTNASLALVRRVGMTPQYGHAERGGNWTL